MTKVKHREEAFKAELNELLTRYNIDMQVSYSLRGYETVLPTVSFYSYDYQPDIETEDTIDIELGEGYYEGGDI
jgi:hypothetical protein